jgi:hypothetical protein
VKTEDPPEKTLAPSSIVAIGHLRENPKLEWAKACRIRIPPKEQYVWLIVTEENQEKLSGTTFDFNHGAVFASEHVEARAGEHVVEINGEIEKQLYGGSETARVNRRALEDEDIQEMISELTNHHN